MGNPDFTAYLKFQIEAATTRIAKEALAILGEITKLNRPISYSEAQNFRKRLLDTNGDAKRELHSCVDKLDIDLKKGN